MLHPDEGTIHAWLDDQLPADERAQLEQHLDQCETCARVVVEARGLVAGASRIIGSLDGVRSGVIPERTPSAAPRGSLWRSLRLTPARAAIAATLLLTTATIFAVQNREAPSTAENLNLAAPASASAPPVVAAAAAPATQPSATSPRPQAARQLPAAAPAPPVASAPSPATAVSGQANVQRRGVMADSASSIVANAAPPARPTTAADSSRFARRSEAAAADLRTLRHVDSIATAMQKAAASASMSASAPRNDFAGRAAFQRALVGTAPAIDSRAVGCYRVDGDSSRAVPSPLHRFSLTKPDSTGGSTVRLIDTGGRRDSTLAGAGWHSLPGDSVLVVAPNGPQRITLIFGVVGEGQRSGGRLAADGRSVSIGVLRTTCP